MRTIQDACAHAARGADPAAELDRWADRAGLAPDEVVERLLAGPAPLERPVVEWCFGRVLVDLPPAVHASTAALFTLLHWLEGQALVSAATAVGAAYRRAEMPVPGWLHSLAARAAVAG